MRPAPGTRQFTPPARGTRGPERNASRILIVSQATVDGVAVCIRDLVEAAVRNGYDVTVACPAAGDLAAWVRGRGAVWVPLEMRRSPHPSDVLAVARLRRLVRTHGLVHLHSSKAGAVGRLALASLGRRRPPSVFTPHGWSWLVGGRLAPAYRLIEKLLFPVTTTVVAVSAEERAIGQAVLGSRAARIKLNPNGVDTSRFRPHGPAASRAHAPLIVCVGRLCHARAPDVAVAALALMRTPGVRLRLVGNGEDRAAVENQASALGLDGRIEFAGFRPDPAPELRAADVVMVPSRYDGMALVLLEAMACGAAIVATRVPGSSVLEGAGILVPAEDPPALAGAADSLLADPDWRRLLGQLARQRVAEQYPLQRSLDGILRLWRSIGADPGQPTGNVSQARERSGRNGSVENNAVDPSGSRDPITPQRVARVLWRRKLVCSLVAAVVFLGGAGWLLTRPKVYESTASVALLPVSTNPNILPNYPNLIASLIPTYVQLY